MEKTTQELFDELVAARGAEAVIEAIKAHRVTANDNGDCQHTGCPIHYICAPSGHCQLDIGG